MIIKALANITASTQISYVPVLLCIAMKPWKNNRDISLLQLSFILHPCKYMIQHFTVAKTHNIDEWSALIMHHLYIWSTVSLCFPSVLPLSPCHCSNWHTKQPGRVVPPSCSLSSSMPPEFIFWHMCHGCCRDYWPTVSRIDSHLRHYCYCELLS